MQKTLILFLLSIWTILAGAQGTTESFQFNFRADLFRIKDYQPTLVQQGDSTYLKITALNETQNVDQRIRGEYIFLLNNQDTAVIDFHEGVGQYALNEQPRLLLINYLVSESGEEVVDSDQRVYQFSEDGGESSSKEIPMWMSLLPPLLAILLALIFKEVIISLFAGVWIGAFIVYGLNFKYFLLSLFYVVDHYIITAISDPGHISVIVFSLMIGGMVAIISRNGGMAGIVNKLSRFANSAKNSQIVTWILGVAIFFDDYANTLIVGNTMRPVTDRYRVSREKLAYIVDSTAAPVAAIAFITTWIGAELGYISAESEVLGIEESAYSIFIHSLQYAFYPIFTLAFMLMLIITKRDFGSMRKAELRARQTGQLYEDRSNKGEAAVDDSLKALDPVPGARQLWYNALVPVLTVILVTILALFYTGGKVSEWNSGAGFFTNVSTIIGNADSYVALLWASLSGLVVAILLSILTNTLSFRCAIETLMDGFKTMLPAVVILVLAWALAATTSDLYTAEFLTEIFSGNVSPHVMGILTFFLAAAISFSTGSSWSTMAILYPIILPTTYLLSQEAGLPQDEVMQIFYNVVAAVLGGSVLGDHCSPISDTTVLSSLATSCNHIDHVRTQLPYALTIGFICLLCDGLFDFLNVPWFLIYPAGLLMIYLIVRFIAKPVPDYIPKA